MDEQTEAKRWERWKREGFDMRIHGFQKLTLLDFPGKVACTVFWGSCNFRCPFCHNGNLVLNEREEAVILEEDVLAVLEKRKKILDGVCVTGGEPTLDEGLAGFLWKVKEMGYLVKLDTNGYKPGVLKDLVRAGLVDYVAMDIKNAPGKYAKTAGVEHVDLLRIQESVGFLKRGEVEYEFRTTVTRELHGREEFEIIGRWLEGSSRYFLQNYRESEFVITREFSGYSREQLERFRDILLNWIPVVEIRGVD